MADTGDTTAVNEEEKKSGGCCGGCCKAKENVTEAQENNTITNGGVKGSRGICGCWSDPIFFLVFIAFIIAMFYVLGYAMAQGNYKRIAYGTDWAGNACGDSKYGTEKMYHQMWPNPLYYKQLGSICLETCPETKNVPNLTSSGQNVTVGTGANQKSTDKVQSCASCLVYCSCNNALTIGREESGVSNSLNDTKTTSWLGKECMGTMKKPKAQGYGPRQNDGSYSYVIFTTGTNVAADGLNWFIGGVSTSLYYYLPGVWQGAYPSNIQAAASLASGGNIPEKKMFIPNCNFGYNTVKLLNRCIPKLDSKTYVSVFCAGDPKACPGSSYFSSYMDSASEYGQRLFADLWTCWYVFLVSWFLAIFLGFLYMYFMEKCAKCLVWTVVLLAITMSGLLFVACCTYALHLKEQTETTPQLPTYEADHRNMIICWVFGAIFGALAFVLLCIAVCWCRAINDAATIIELASEAMLDFPYLVLYPPAQVVGIGVLLVFWTMGALQLASSGSQEPDPMYSVSSYTYSDDQKYMAIFWLFGGFWIAEFVMACGFMIVSFCFAIWFFSPEVDTDGDGRKDSRATPSFVLWKSMKMTYLHHLGTLAFGSLILAIIDLLRVIVEYIDKKRKELAGEGSKCWDFIFCIMRCCLYCLDKYMRFLNKQAYIQTVINGTSLCTSACRALAVMISHIPIFAVMCGIQSGIFWFGRLAISVGTAAICGFWISKLDVSSMVLPTCVCLVIGYIISNTIMCVYEMGIDTMLMCWCEVEDNKELMDKIPSALSGHIEAAQGKHKENEELRASMRASQLGQSSEKSSV